jgi:hypothetical protein
VSHQSSITSSGVNVVSADIASRCFVHRRLFARVERRLPNPLLRKRNSRVCARWLICHLAQCLVAAGSRLRSACVVLGVCYHHPARSFFSQRSHVPGLRRCFFRLRHFIALSRHFCHNYSVLTAHSGLLPQLRLFVVLRRRFRHFLSSRRTCYRLCAFSTCSGFSQRLSRVLSSMVLLYGCTFSGLGLLGYQCHPVYVGCPGPWVHARKVYRQSLVMLSQPLCALD